MIKVPIFKRCLLSIWGIWRKTFLTLSPKDELFKKGPKVEVRFHIWLTEISRGRVLFMQNPLLNFVNTIAWNVIVPGVTNPVTYGDSAYNTTSKWIGLKHSTDSCNQYIIKTSKKKEEIKCRYCLHSSNCLRNFIKLYHQICWSINDRRFSKKSTMQPLNSLSLSCSWFEFIL